MSFDYTVMYTGISMYTDKEENTAKFKTVVITYEINRTL